MLLASNLLGQARGPCLICGTAQCCCRGQNEPLVGRPIELAAIREKGGVVTRVQAQEDIYIDKPGQIGARTLLYKAGDYVREEDLEALGLGDTQAKPAAEPPEDKAKRGPREGAKKRASRDKALSEPKEG